MHGRKKPLVGRVEVFGLLVQEVRGVALREHMFGQYGATYFVLKRTMTVFELSVSLIGNSLSRLSLLSVL